MPRLRLPQHRHRLLTTSTVLPRINPHHLHPSLRSPPRYPAQRHLSSLDPLKSLGHRSNLHQIVKKRRPAPHVRQR